ncbi:VOC family protein [Blastococcus capsensis]|uniref:VOC family protein n=1 Tax=Blastococcus capsensis TaxID=1564163 RepID=UPI002540F7C3|nr:VOC family protein [Blastococcus capsensis]MDK3256088.1 VOC family protein [Blastococcus capsensis]
MPVQVTPFLMFTGDAERAIELYTSLFDDAQLLTLTRFGADGTGVEGTVEQATFSIAGQVFRCFDSPPVHAFTFTPSFSVFVDVASAEELERLFAGLSDGGGVLMPLDDYGFSRRFGWVNDRFGVSWQLNLAYSREDERRAPLTVPAG